MLCFVHPPEPKPHFLGSSSWTKSFKFSMFKDYINYYAKQLEVDACYSDKTITAFSPYEYFLNDAVYTYQFEEYSTVMEKTFILYSMTVFLVMIFYLNKYNVAMDPRH